MTANIKRKDRGVKEGRTLHCLCGEAVGKITAASTPLNAGGSVIDREFCLNLDSVLAYTLGTVVRGVGGVEGCGMPASAIAAASAEAAAAAAAEAAPAAAARASSSLEERVQRLEADMYKAQCLILCLNEKLDAGASSSVCM